MEIIKIKIDFIPSTGHSLAMPSNPSYHVVSFEIEPALQDLACGVLYDHDCLGLEEENKNQQTVRIKAYFEASEPLSQFIPLISQWVPQAKNINGTTIDLQSIASQMPTFEPVELTPGVWIIPPEDMPARTKIESKQKLIIRPGMGFGTGRHETTQLVALAMERFKSKKNSFLDVGSGSGILALMAKKIIGMTKVDAVEIDEHARENSLENFQLNNVTGIQLYKDISQLPPFQYDLIGANIISTTLIYLKHKILFHLKSNGILILSGILTEEENEIKEAFADLNLIEIKTKKEWACLVYQL